jgi:CheY-like chemotaxis protein
MGRKQPAAADKRAFPRGSVVGSAIVIRGEAYVGTYVLENLSAGGALLAGDTKLSIGERVRIMLQLHVRARRFVLEASVARHETRGDQGVFAVRFERLSAAAQDAIHDAVVHELKRSPSGSVVLIIDSAVGHADDLARQVEELGSTAVPLGNALEAVAWLQTSVSRTKAVIVDAGLDVVDGLAMLQFIAHDYPAVRRVLACNEEEPFRSALDSGAVHALLVKPWDPTSVRRVLGVSRPAD